MASCNENCKYDESVSPNGRSHFLKKAISVQVNSHFESFTDTECKWMQIFPNKDAKYITHPFYLNGILQASNF